MKRPLRLTVLGGGSYFTPSFIGSMVARPDVWAGAEVRLQDIAPSRTHLVKAFCEKYAARKGLPLTVVEQPDLDRALDGADFVIATFRIGGIPALELDETIPPRFGYLGDETAGPGGLFMAIRTVPVVMDVARRMERLCPDAWLLNYANPTHYCVAGVARTTRTKVVGLCDNYIAGMADFSWLLEIEPLRRIRARHVGYNHCCWIYSAEFEGRDLMRELRERDPERLQRQVEKSERARWMFEQNLMLFRHTGWFPLGMSHFLAYFYHAEFFERHRAAERRPHAGVRERDRKHFETLAEQVREYRDEVADTVARAQHGGAHADLAIGVATAIASDSGDEFPVNMPHGEAVGGLAPATVVDLWGKVRARGIELLRPPPFPPMIREHQQLLFAYMELVLRGILEKNKDRFFDALLIHPFTQSAAKARELLDAMWEEERHLHGPYWTDVR